MHSSLKQLCSTAVPPITPPRATDPFRGQRAEQLAGRTEQTSHDYLLIKHELLRAAAL